MVQGHVDPTAAELLLDPAPEGMAALTLVVHDQHQALLAIQNGSLPSALVSRKPVLGSGELDAGLGQDCPFGRRPRRREIEPRRRQIPPEDFVNALRDVCGVARCRDVVCLGNDRRVGCASADVVDEGVQLDLGDLGGAALQPLLQVGRQSIGLGIGGAIDGLLLAGLGQRQAPREPRDAASDAFDEGVEGGAVAHGESRR